MISSSAIILGICSSTGLLGGFKLATYIGKRNQEVDSFYNYIVEAADKYFEKHPKVSQEYFNDILNPIWFTKLCFWERNLENLVIDEEKVEELIMFRKRLSEEGEMEIVFTPEAEQIFISCPWCGNEDLEEYSWMELEEKDGIGALHCRKCGMFTPIATYDECIELLKKDDE